MGLFLLALVLKGLTHDILLEAGVFLVSTKLILMSKKNAEAESRMESRLDEIKTLLEKANLNKPAGSVCETVSDCLPLGYLVLQPHTVGWWFSGIRGALIVSGGFGRIGGC